MSAAEFALEAGQSAYQHAEMNGAKNPDKEAQEAHETALLMYEHGALGRDYYDCFRNMDDGVNGNERE